MCLNSRPLTPIPNSPDDLEVLTPGHFITGSNLQMVHEVDVTKIPDNRLTHWERTQKIMQAIWARWYPEYLQQLQARATKGCKPPVKVELGKLKLFHFNPGKDDIVRVVSLKTIDGKTITRPVAKIALLPLQD
uniref:DUF5641 domain-containing protein n=1 Tax=Anopheles stephensi TaxID=30069 RepID=A0A182YTF9_ANOST